MTENEKLPVGTKVATMYGHGILTRPGYNFDQCYVKMVDGDYAGKTIYALATTWFQEEVKK